MRNLHRTGVGLGLGLALSCPAAPGALAAPLSPVAVLRPERGFIDDAMALTPDGGTLYYVATDAATFAELRSAKLAGQSGALQGELAVPGLKLSTSGLLPLPEGRVLVIETDPEGQRKTAQAVSPKLPKAAPSPRIGPATAIVLTTAAGAPAVVAYSAPKAEGEHRIQTLSAATLRPLSDRRFRALPGGALSVGGSSASLLHVGEGYQTLELKQAGDYDKKADVRKPDQLAVLDTASGKLRRGETVSDPTALAEQQQVLKGHPGESAFLHHDAERGVFELWTASGGAAVRSPLKLPRPAAVYNASTLRYQALGKDLLLFSITVDPVNEAAVARKRSDPDTIDLCVARTADRSVRCLGEIPGKDRPSSWTAAPDGTLVLLRKHKGFSRGGTEVELYRLDLGGDQGGAGR